jgi:hypothetical protein
VPYPPLFQMLELGWVEFCGLWHEFGVLVQSDRFHAKTRCTWFSHGFGATNQGIASFCGLLPGNSSVDPLYGMTRSNEKGANGMPQSGFPGTAVPPDPAFRLALCKSAWLLTFIGGLLAGCSTNELSSDPPRPGTGVKEYRQITAKATTSILEALHWLDRIDSQTNRCPPSLVAAFGGEVQQLQVETRSAFARVHRPSRRAAMPISHRGPKVLRT